MKALKKAMEAIYLPEPQLGFGYQQVCDHPKDGLFLYGPHVNGKPKKEICIGVVGTKEGVAYLQGWMKKMCGFIEVPPRKKTEKENRLHLSPFPGIQEVFGISIAPDDFVVREIDGKKLDEVTRTVNHYEAVKKSVDIYINEIEYHDRNEERKVDVWLLVLPELVFERCKPQAKRSGLSLIKGDFIKQQKVKVDLPLLESIIDQQSEEIFDDVPDFHRQVKARLLKLGYTSQLVRETTVAPGKFLNKAGYPVRALQDEATVAWNMATGLYYKTQSDPPWKMANIRQGVCYVGLVFKLIPNDPKEHACCAAQMFLSEGDGVVFRGANGPWKTGEREFHLGKSEAKKMIQTVIKTYEDKHGSKPKELFIHGRTKFNDNEWRAFAEAAPKGTNIIAIRIKTTAGDTKLFRDGDYPVLRGTAIILDDQNAYLWTTGFAPRLDTYIGPETPNPLFITILKSTGEAPDIRTVLSDILGLTKMNYNACNYSDGLPVTIRFADKVGDVLVMGSARDTERQPFKFYI